MHFSTALLALAAAATIVSAHDDHYEEGDDYDNSGDDYSYEHSSSDEYSAPSTSAYDEHTSVPYFTEVLTVYTTYCPSATKIVHGSTTYTVTEPTTLTISDCPCTVSKPVYTSSVTVCSTCDSSEIHPTPTSATEIYPVPTTEVHPTNTPPPPAPYHSEPAASSNGTTVSPVYPPKTPTASGPASYSSAVSGTSPPIAEYTGAASRMMMVGAGAWFAVVAGACGMLLV